MAKQGDEQTFRSYSDEDANKYAKSRPQYSPQLYELLTSHHTASGGKLDTVVDVGCGPGVATFQLTKYFKTVIGIDPSEGMINVARSRLAGMNVDGADVTFQVAKAEDIDVSLIPDGSVDVITAATCAHWFDMARFWPTAARILRPGGTVAIWGSRQATMQKSVPNGDKINAALDEMEEKELSPYTEPGNNIARGLYQALELPWTAIPPASDQFDESTFYRKVFGTEEGGDGEGEDVPYLPWGNSMACDMDQMERILSTTSQIARWRQAHPEAVGTEDDLLRRIRRMIEKYLHEGGVKQGEEKVTVGILSVLMMVKKRS